MSRLPTSPQSPICSHTSGSLRVTYRDTDRMGHVYYAQYLVWMEIGRTELLRSLGSSYREWEDDHGIFLPVRECSIRYRLPAEYDELIRVETRMVRITRASVEFEYDVIREQDNRLLATGGTAHAFVDAQGSICRVADRLLPQFF